jgi:hypothetical protein
VNYHRGVTGPEPLRFQHRRRGAVQQLVADRVRDVPVDRELRAKVRESLQLSWRRVLEPLTEQRAERLVHLALDHQHGQVGADPPEHEQIVM